MTCIIVKEFEQDGKFCHVGVHGLGERDGALLNIKCDGKMEDGDPRGLLAPNGIDLPTSKILSHLIELKFCIVSQSSVGYSDYSDNANYERTVTIWTLVKNT